ncbi:MULTISPECIES: hypothetical protein [Brevibacillus]|uniref:hypothetical protein n=1 Tax=Brevibacillus TaxID=55080 RepID=UPI0002A4F8EA|nr:MULTISPECIES: hypothetical protein [Brevibacillus]ELK38929.1 hypothetical protein D478_27087 [Brevibacillus agri BAB-2500]MBY0050959.1 hypothetical protein [Brevibacillus agri]MED4572239.1 hypothetical protein [Brevibacillus agri]QHZ57929.1 hypothetical protein M655_020970 [Brevibacillus sp. NSP2.1]WHX31948.1 hypothetical protein QNK09_06995 [Brevibacillus agri]
MKRRLIFIITLILISGCSNSEVLNKEQPTQSINNVTYPADNPPVVGEAGNEKSIEEPIYQRLIKYYNSNSISEFEVTNYAKISKTIFCTINFKVDNKLHYGLVQAYPKDKGWVIQSINETPEIPDLAVVLQMSVGKELVEENETIKQSYRIYSGYINEKQVKEIRITTTDDRMYVIKIGDNQKQFLYASPREEVKAKFVALDQNGKIIYEQ